MCSAGSRLLIQESVYDDVIARLKVRMSHLRLGHSLDKTIDMGAVVDETQRQLVDKMVESARAEGAEVILSHSSELLCHATLNVPGVFEVCQNVTIKMLI